MRSSWSAERLLLFLAAVSLEGAWLTLAYLGLQWMAGVHAAHLGIAELAGGAAIGLLGGRYLRHASPESYAGIMLAAAIAAGLVGLWLGVPGGRPDLRTALAVNPAGWLLGVAVLRGTAHGDLEDEAGAVERFLNAGLVGLGVFWVLASGSTLTKDGPATQTAFAATLTFVSATLLALGLARLGDLRVEGIDRGARQRWLVMLVGVSLLVLVIGIPLAALLGVPLATVLAGMAGPLAPILIFVIVALSIPLGLLAEALARLFPPLAGPPAPTPGPIASGAGGQGTPGGLPWFQLDLTWLFWLAMVAVAILVLLAIASWLRRPALDHGPDAETELRETEPIGGGLLPSLPHLHLPGARRRPRRVPRSAVEAYRVALDLLVGTHAERGPGETPRRHARRVAADEVGGPIGRLAVDYQLSAFAGHTVTAREEQRAIDRWRRIERSVRSRRDRGRPDGGGDAPVA